MDTPQLLTSIGTTTSHCLHFSELFDSTTTALVIHTEWRDHHLEPFNNFTLSRAAQPVVIHGELPWSTLEPNFEMEWSLAPDIAPHLLQQDEKLPHVPPSSWMSFADPSFPVSKPQITPRHQEVDF